MKKCTDFQHVWTKKNAGNVLTCNSWVCHRHKKKILLWLYSDINVLNSFLRIRTWLLTPLPPQSMILQCPFLHQYTHNVYLSWFRFATDYNPWFLSSVASVKVRNTSHYITQITVWTHIGHIHTFILSHTKTTINRNVTKLINYTPAPPKDNNKCCDVNFKEEN